MENKYTHVIYPTARALVWDEKEGVIREATAEELERLRQQFDPILKRSMLELKRTFQENFDV